MAADNRLFYLINHFLLDAQGRAAIEAARREFAAKTCIRLVPRTNQRDYVRVIAGGG